MLSIEILALLCYISDVFHLDFDYCGFYHEISVLNTQIYQKGR